ncbi:MAG: bL17 family ribosomal protein [Acidaminococcus sp.]|nr:bL17 family ribosomal protein [Acidaminococcus sp.]MDD7397809.1 bL17 family ribosomal protein [Bacillota bacterium]MDY5345485.1 bL17 family ribosomal protein [Eubacteriales bacterium]
MPKKLGKRSDQRMALLKNQVSELLWYGQIETTVDRAKAVKSIAEKLITVAINSYEDTVKVTKQVKNAKGETVKKEFTNDGPKKLAARRKLMANLRDLQEVKSDKESKANFKARTKDIKHPLVEKMFNEHAPKYAARRDELGQGGGYTQMFRLGERRGDAAEMCVLKLI